ncbi:MAG TPA: glycosyltransferase family 39 protein [Patescibacteria group bacterium]|nr:glycosyltransferase family 39 protein [Patescibacteria group bacterium]
MTRYFGTGIWLVLLLSLLTIFVNLGGIPLLDPDEPVYAETAKEMMHFADFVSPRIYGEFWYDKPPMYYWLVAASFKLFGVTEFAARLPAAALAVLGGLVVYGYGNRLFGEKAGLASAVVLVTSVEYFYMGKAAVTDITLTLCLTISLLAFIAGQYRLCWLFAGLATVTKGPVGFLFPGAVIFLYLTLDRRWHEIRYMKIPTGLLIFAVSALPWYVAMYGIHGQAFIDTFLGFHNLTRFTSPEHPEGVLWYYFVPVLIVGFFPWSGLLLQSVWAALSRSRGPEKSPLLFLTIWAVFIFLFFSVSQTKLVSYILPMFPPLSLVVGWYAARLWEERHDRPWGWALTSSGIAVVLAAALWLLREDIPELREHVWVMIAVLTLMALGSLLFCWRRQMRTLFWTQASGMVLFSVVLVTLLFPAVAVNFSMKQAAAEFLAQYDGRSPVYVIKFLHPGFTFYADVYGKEILGDSGLKRALNAPEPQAYYIVRRSEFDRLAAAEQQKVDILSRVADKVILKKK